MVVRVVVAEDTLLVREGVVRVLDHTDGFETAAAVGTYDELLAATADLRPDAVVTDIRMPPTMTDEGIRAARELRMRQPDIGVVVLSQYAEPAYALALLEQGAGGRAYLLKERVAEPDELTAAITAVTTGGSVIDPRVVEVLVSSRNERPSPLDHLTTREREVLAAMAEGKNNAAIAAALYLSSRAVEKHINALFSKLGLSEEHDVHRRVMAVLVFLSSTAAGRMEGG